MIPQTADALASWWLVRLTLWWLVRLASWWLVRLASLDSNLTVPRAFLREAFRPGPGLFLASPLSLDAERTAGRPEKTCVVRFARTRDSPTTHRQQLSTLNGQVQLTSQCVHTSHLDTCMYSTSGASKRYTPTQRVAWHTYSSVLCPTAFILRLCVGVGVPLSPSASSTFNSNRGTRGASSQAARHHHRRPPA